MTVCRFLSVCASVDRELPRMQSFKGVSVSFPGGSQGLFSLEDYRNVSWPHWSAGELRIDTESFALVFLPQGADHLRAKPFGCLYGALQTEPLEAGVGTCTFVTSTSDPVHGIIRLGFTSQADEMRFFQLAQAAEHVNATQYGSSRRSTMCSGRRSSVGAGMGVMALVEAVTEVVREENPGTWPLVYPGCEFYSGEGGAQVLVARGCAVLLDRPDTHRLGEYWLAFYEEGSSRAALTVPIGPRMKIARHNDTGGDMHPGARASRGPSMGGCSRDSLSGWGSPLAIFRLSIPGHQPLELAFDQEADAESFARDLNVRQRLTAMSLKTARGESAFGRLQDQLCDMQSRGFVATFRRLVWQASVLIVVAMLFYGVALYISDMDRPVSEIVAMTVADACDTVFVGVQRFQEAGSVICSAVTPAQVPQAELDRCLALPDAHEARSCARTLMITA